jgi:alanine racemase
VHYTIKDIAKVLGEEPLLPNPSITIEHLLIDSRRIIFPATSVFFALQSARRNGEDYIEDIYSAGVRCFIVTKNFTDPGLHEANYIKVDEPLRALQKIVAHHRSRFSLPVIGITGSNGKTIVKEWLYQLLHTDYKIARSPKSYNSQIGVPLSVWQLNETHTLGIFEAGISEAGEMDYLEKIIKPSIGILTNIGAAHAAGFPGKQEKLQEKWKLFKNCSSIICSKANPLIASFAEQEPADKIFSWDGHDVNLTISDIKKHKRFTDIHANYKGEPVSISIPFTDNASVENAINCWCIMLLLQIDNDIIAERMLQLQQVEMRLQLKKAINDCSIINDSYSNDLSSLKIALDFLQQQSGRQKTTVILSDLGDVASTNEKYDQVLEALVQHKVNTFIGIGPRLNGFQEFFKEALSACYFYLTVDEFFQHFSATRFKDEIILLKGARAFQFEQINLLFEQKVHQTVLEVNLSAMVHNLKEYQRYVKPETKVMAMVKAFSYGSGIEEVARILQFHKLDYLAVAYADEGVELRKAGIHLPVMVMNPEVITFPSLVDYNLEPELYSFSILEQFSQYLDSEGVQQFPVHLKIDTGMHRLGFEPSDIDTLVSTLQTTPNLVVKSVFTHMVASENEQLDAFSHEQAKQFMSVCEALQNALGYSFMRHLSNSAAIFRYPAYQFDMVRLGIGLYGVDSIGNSALNLVPVATLRTTIAQVRTVVKGETVGYNRKGILERDSIIATIRIGYADGFSRRLGNGKGKVYVKGKLAPVVGNVCMDMTMIDITDIEGVNEGDFVEVFGANIPVQQIAEWSETIPYEIMTSVSQRVKREYYEE